MPQIERVQLAARLLAMVLMAPAPGVKLISSPAPTSVHHNDSCTAVTLSRTPGSLDVVIPAGLRRQRNGHRKALPHQFCPPSSGRAQLIREGFTARGS